MYNDFILYTTQIADFDLGFELTETMINAVDAEHLSGYNFGRYSEEGEDRVWHISVRLDLDDDQIPNVREKLEELVRDGIIDDFAVNSPSIRLFREYSINHKLAHEASTECAFKFYEKKNENPQDFREFTNDIIGFFREFIPLWLKYSGFNFNQVETIADSLSNLVNELAQECSIIVTNIDHDQITDCYTFNERLIHIFLNCIGIPIIQDRQLCNEIARRFGYANPVDFFIDLRL